MNHIRRFYKPLHTEPIAHALLVACDIVNDISDGLAPNLLLNCYLYFRPRDEYSSHLMFVHSYYGKKFSNPKVLGRNNTAVDISEKRTLKIVYTAPLWSIE